MAEQFIELGLLGKPAISYTNNKLAAALWLVDHLLTLISELPVESESLLTTEFRSQLNQFRVQLTNPSPGATNEFTAKECFALCHDYVERVGTYLVEREAEFNQIINVLRNTIAELAGEASNFQDRLDNSSKRISQLTDIEDIRELKKLLAQEVTELKRTIAEKQKREEDSFRQLYHQMQGLQTKLSRAQVEASLDALTGVANRRSFDDEVSRWVTGYREHGRPFALAMIDVDNFKLMNDTYGHLAGDFVLQCVAKFFKSNLRSSDFIGRYGGEEFVILLGNIKLQQAETKLSSLVTQLADTTFHYHAGEQSHALKFTVSCGVAECGARENQWELILRSDGALYEAKRRGKNQVVTTW